MEFAERSSLFFANSVCFRVFPGFLEECFLEE